MIAGCKRCYVFLRLLYDELSNAAKILSLGSNCPDFTVLNNINQSFLNNVISNAMPWLIRGNYLSLLSYERITQNNVNFKVKVNNINKTNTGNNKL